MSKSGLLWIDVPGDRAWPAWYAWTGEQAYVLNGPGEQHLPWLPRQVELILKSKDTGGRLLRVRATTDVLRPGEPEYAAAVEALAAKRLNSRPEAEAAWAAECTVTALRVDPEPVEGPGHYPQESFAQPPATSPATTLTWHPFHVKGRANPLRRRRSRRAS